MYGHTYSKSKYQPGKVANPARGQLSREICRATGLSVLANLTHSLRKNTSTFPAFGNLNFVSPLQRRAYTSLSKPCPIETFLHQDFITIKGGSYRAVLMGTKSCTKILNFRTRFSCENLAVEDFVTLVKVKKSC